MLLAVALTPHEEERPNAQHDHGEHGDEAGCPEWIREDGGVWIAVIRTAD